MRASSSGLPRILIFKEKGVLRAIFHRIWRLAEEVERVIHHESSEILAGSAQQDSKELTGLVKKIHKLKGVRETETFIVHSTVKNEPEAPFMKVLSE